MPYRVIQWSTGNVGRLALRTIIEHPDLELVGLWVSSREKAGKDAGTLCGLAPVGVAATNDADALLAMQADAVCYTATADLRPADAIDDLCRILASGKNVVSTSVVPLVFPPGAVDQDGVRKLEAACQQGKTSCFTSGIDPGFANDLLPLALVSGCARVDTLRVSEIVNYATYDQAQVLFHTMGFAKPMDHTPLLLIPGVLTIAWGATVRSLAKGLGVELDEIREVHERRVTDKAFDVSAGPVPAGTVAALRFEVQGMVKGRPAVVIEHVTRLHDDLCPDWPRPTEGAGCYLIRVEGSPNVTCEVAFDDPQGDHNSAGLIATAAKVLNAIPAVCAAKPGLVSVHDLPLPTGMRVMR